MNSEGYLFWIGVAFATFIAACIPDSSITLRELKQAEARCIKNDGVLAVSVDTFYVSSVGCADGAEFSLWPNPLNKEIE